VADVGVDGAPAAVSAETTTGAKLDAEPVAARRSSLADAPAWVGGLALIAVFVVWGQKGGGFDTTVWVPGAFLALGLTVVVVGSAGIPRLERRRSLAVLALAGFAAWSYASLLWADVPGDAWIGANRTLLYLAVFAAFLLLPWTPRAATAALWLFAGGVTTVAALAIFHVATTENDEYFVDGRFSYPTGYANANVALFMAGFWVALALATRREQPVLVRSLALGAVAFLPQAALIVQSRAAVVAVPLAAVLVLLVAPGRLRTALGLAAAVVPLGAGWDVHLKVFEQAEVGGAFLQDAMQPSARFMAASSAVAVVAGLAWAAVDRRLAIPPRALRAANVLAALAAAGALLAGAALVARSEPLEHARTAWHQLTSNAPDPEGASRFGTLGGERWDHWRVAMRRFLDRPLTGIGAEQFTVDYLKARRTPIDARYPHSLEVGILSQLGVVGGALFAVFAVLATLLVRPRRADEPAVSTLRLAAFGLWVYWLAHASFDWFYEIPALTAPVLAVVALAASLGSSAVPSPPPRRRSPLLVAAVCSAAALAVLALGAPYLAARELKRALAVWSQHPELAYARLERARTLDPLSDEPDLYAGAIAARLDDRPRMRLHFERALERNPHSWYAHLELGLTRSVDGRRREAVQEVRRALALNPREPIVADVLRRLRRGETIPPRSLDRLFVERVVERLR
jgi:tetratricopeptide (TPR) repeat protein